MIPQDRILQAVQWNDIIYVDLMLPFGLRSAPKLLNAIADALEWILHQQGIAFCKHYLDDFIIAGPPKCQNCRQALEMLDKVCDWAGSANGGAYKEGPNNMFHILRH